MKLQTTIFGAGVVGRGTGALLQSGGVDFNFIDPDQQLIEELSQLGHSASTQFVALCQSVTAFICVPTPASQAIGYDLSIVHECAMNIVRESFRMKVKRLVLIIRSTVPPGTCQNLISSILQTENSDSCECSVVAMPEFLRATHAIEDALNPRLTVIGSFDHSANVYVRKLASAVTSKISVFDDPAYAEMIKLAHNAFNATKISFWNEMFQIGQLYGLNTQKVADAVSLTSEASWNPSYGIRGGTPYAGACLPKDVIGFIKHVENAGLNPDMLISIDAVNQKQKQ